MKWLLRFLLLLSLALALYFYWSLTDRAKEQKSGWLNVPKGNIRMEVAGSGADTFRNNVVGIQPYLTAINYSTSFNLETTLSLYMQQLHKEALLQPRSVVLFPAGIGNGLLFTHEKENIFRKTTYKDALRLMVASNFWQFAWQWLLSGGSEKTDTLLFRIKAAAMAAHYQNIFSRLAKENKCTIVAGSILLPDAFVDNAGKLKINLRGKLFPTTAVFDSSGKIIAPLIKYDSHTQAQVVSTPAGKMLLLHKGIAGKYPEADFFVSGITHVPENEQTALLLQYLSQPDTEKKLPSKGMLLYLHSDYWEKNQKANGWLYYDTLLQPRNEKGRTALLELRLR